MSCPEYRTKNYNLTLDIFCLLLKAQNKVTTAARKYFKEKLKHFRERFFDLVLKQKKNITLAY